MPRRLFTATIENGASETDSALAELPFEFHAVPVSRIVRTCTDAMLDDLHAGLNRFDWLFFTSANAVSIFLENRPRKEPGPRIACVGPNTADLVERMGHPVSLVAEVHTGAALAEKFIALYGAEGPSVLLPRPEKMGSDLVERLTMAGESLTQAVLYRTDPLTADGAPDWSFRDSDLFVFMSPSGVKHFTRIYTMPEKSTAVAIGTTTAAALRAAGHARVAVAARACREGLLDTVSSILNNSTEQEGC